MPSTPPRMIIGISGATSVIYGIRLLQVLKQQGIETHLVVTKAGEMTRAYETDLSMHQLRELANVWYPVTDVGAAISSGSFKTMGMIIAPCSIRTMSEIAHGITSNLLTRAADVVLKERRCLVLMLRETPLMAGHLKSMLAVTESGGIVAPPVSAFYIRPRTIEELVDHAVGRVLDLFDIEIEEDLILPIVVAGEPVEEDHTVQGIPSAAETLALLREAGIPATMAWVTLEAANHWLVVTLPNTWKQQTGLERKALFQKIGDTFFQSKFGAVIPKIIVLNDDIDASNTKEVVWGFATRVRPVSGEYFFNHEATSPLVAFLTADEKFSFDTTKVVYDGLAPDEWGERLPKRTSFKHNYSKELQEHVLRHWETDGFPA